MVLAAAFLRGATCVSPICMLYLVAVQRPIRVQGLRVSRNNRSCLFTRRSLLVCIQDLYAWWLSRSKAKMSGGPGKQAGCLVATGLAASMVYQVAWTMPRWQHLVANPLLSSGYSLPAAAAAFAIFGAVYVVHTFAQVQLCTQPHRLGCTFVFAGLLFDESSETGFVNVQLYGCIHVCSRVQDMKYQES